MTGDSADANTKLHISSKIVNYWPMTYHAKGNITKQFDDKEASFHFRVHLAFFSDMIATNLNVKACVLFKNKIAEIYSTHFDLSQ